MEPVKEFCDQKFQYSVNRLGLCSFGARLIQSTNLRVILQFRAYQFGIRVTLRNHEEKPTILNSSSSKRSPVFRLLINHEEEEAARKTQEEKLREWRYNKRTAEMIAEYERDQEKEAKQSRPERDKWKKPFNKEATRSYLGSRSNGDKPNSLKKAVQKPQSKPVVETPSTRTEENMNKGFEK
ncbi:hypothetical protein F2Q69_00059360 [Brassica cretica]|uniref:Uncharacterized protein n=1 Tax=Brassica cretica TaxID=69181 RepID=A0A8S9RN99_BRACR|nr:hypothetical protein F2Q69_00059360 [Brassica cretica]